MGAGGGRSRAPGAVRRGLGTCADGGRGGGYQVLTAGVGCRCDPRPGVPTARGLTKRVAKTTRGSRPELGGRGPPGPELPPHSGRRGGADARFALRSLSISIPTRRHASCAQARGRPAAAPPPGPLTSSGGDTAEKGPRARRRRAACSLAHAPCQGLGRAVRHAPGSPAPPLPEESASPRAFASLPAGTRRARGAGTARRGMAGVGAEGGGRVLLGPGGDRLGDEGSASRPGPGPRRPPPTRALLDGRILSPGRPPLSGMLLERSRGPLGSLSTVSPEVGVSGWVTTLLPSAELAGSSWRRRGALTRGRRVPRPHAPPECSAVLSPFRTLFSLRAHLAWCPARRCHVYLLDG